MTIQQTRSAPVRSSSDVDKPEGPISAAIIAAGAGAFTLGLVTTLAEASESVADSLRWSTAVGPLSGKTLVTVIVWLVVWAWRVATGNRSLPALAVALRLTTFTYGAIIGVLRQIQLDELAGRFPASADVVGAHASAMVFSYLILVAMGLLEWRVLGTTDRPRGGLAQMVLLFLGGVVISFTLLFLPPEAIQPAGGLYLLLELIAVVLFAVRVVPRAVRVSWGSDAAGRHVALSAAFVIVAMLMFMYLIFRFITEPALDVTNPQIVGLLTANDHAAFIGVITNLMLGLLIVLTSSRRDRWAWADRLVFWGVNGGLVIFIVGLVLDVVILKRIGAPLMGVSLLLALAPPDAARAVGFAVRAGTVGVGVAV